MIKAKMMLTDGRSLIVLGLSFGNLDKLHAEPGNTFLNIKGSDMDIPFDILIFSGETEAHCVKLIEGGITPETVLHVNPKVKN